MRRFGGGRLGQMAGGQDEDKTEREEGVGSDGSDTACSMATIVKT